jgi:hypothetical protein
VHGFNAASTNECHVIWRSTYVLHYGYMYENNKYLHSQRLSLRRPSFLACSHSYTTQDHLGSHGEGFHTHL